MTRLALAFAVVLIGAVPHAQAQIGPQGRPPWVNPGDDPQKKDDRDRQAIPYYIPHPVHVVIPDYRRGPEPTRAPGQPAVRGQNAEYPSSLRPAEFHPSVGPAEFHPPIRPVEYHSPIRASEGGGRWFGGLFGGIGAAIAAGLRALFGPARKEGSES